MSEREAAPVDTDDAEHEDVPCYRHSNRLTALHCISCERPVCIDCARPAAVGIKCRECGRLPRAALAAVPPARLAFGLVAGLAAGLLAGFVYAELRGAFFGLIIAALLGMGIGEVVRRATGGYRDPQVGWVAAVSAFIGLSWPLLLLVVQHGAGVLQSPGAIFGLLGALIAAFLAFNRTT